MVLRMSRPDQYFLAVICRSRSGQACFPLSVILYSPPVKNFTEPCFVQTNFFSDVYFTYETSWGVIKGQAAAKIDRLRTILSDFAQAWFDLLAKSFSYKEVGFK